MSGLAGQPASLDDPQAPLRCLRYEIGQGDALIWQRQPRELRGWRYFALFAAPVACGMAYAATEEFLALGARLTVAAGAGIAVFLLAQVLFQLADRRAARRQVPTQQEATLEIWGDHLCETRGGITRNFVPERNRQVVLTPHHLFIEDAGGLLILPLTAFEDRPDMETFAAHWDARAHEAQP